MAEMAPVGTSTDTSQAKIEIDNATRTAEMSLIPANASQGKKEIDNTNSVADIAPGPGPDPQSPHHYLWPTGLLDNAIGRLFTNQEEMERWLNIHDPTPCKWDPKCPLVFGENDPPTRKSMSHIFGRNKTCTRSIPFHVWLSFCRKHYQRERYRNIAEYVANLAQIVEIQVLRVESWSYYNHHSGTPENGIVQSWAIQLRKRQALLLEKKKAEAKAEAEGEQAMSPQPSSSVVPVPDWVHDWVGQDYTAATIQKFLIKIYDELLNSRLGQFPEIEILPTITGANAKPENKRRKRQQDESEAGPSQPPSRRRRSRQESSTPAQLAPAPPPASQASAIPQVAAGPALPVSQPPPRPRRAQPARPPQRAQPSVTAGPALPASRQLPIPQVPSPYSGVMGPPPHNMYGAQAWDCVQAPQQQPTFQPSQVQDAYNFWQSQPAVNSFNTQNIEPRYAGNPFSGHNVDPRYPANTFTFQNVNPSYPANTYAFQNVDPLVPVYPFDSQNIDPQLANYSFNSQNIDSRRSGML
ncbi:uncharacterized protein B0T15DRAFT_549931 [Chaetomium strumarium]|uniref:Uncharacterized protein n=1 Tax=Chaetomium strumarium TaxID=1170767 RepID=A0AAJ0GXJ4_9PEZI|nr:hypothetical protein B0T15DRAFT_549931 [Chaetomium strumarium]